MADMPETPKPQQLPALARFYDWVKHTEQRSALLVNKAHQNAKTRYQEDRHVTPRSV